MTKTNKLLKIFASSLKIGGGILTLKEIAFMMGESPSPKFTNFLANCVKKGIVCRVAQGVFESALTPCSPVDAIYKIAKKIRNKSILYISLESQLSFTGRISQIPMSRITIMTNGRKGVFNTPYGTIEFTHTKKKLSDIADELHMDNEIGMYRASEKLALEDLKRTKRNMDMIC